MLLVVTGLLVGCAMWQDGKMVGAEKANTQFVAEQNCTTLKIDAEASELTVKQGDGEFVTVDYYTGGKIEASISQEGDAIVVTQKLTSHFQARGGEIIVTLPADGTPALELDLAAGNVSLSGLALDSLTVKVNAGNVEIKSCSAPELSATLDAGNFSVENSNFKTVSSSVNVGDLKLKKVSADKLTLTVDVGSIKANLIGKKSEYTLTGTVDVGSKNFAPQTGTTDRSLSASVNVGDISLTFDQN